MSAAQLVPDELVIRVGMVPGSGLPPQWTYRIEHETGIQAHMRGPRLLVLDSLVRWCELLRDNSAPAGDPE